MKTRWIWPLLLLSLVWTSALSAADSIAVIAGKNSGIDKLNPEQIRALFLGETRRLDSGRVVEIGDRDRNSEIYRQFYQQVAEMTPKDIAVHWAKKVFTGKATAPSRITGDDDAAKAWLKTKPDGITYIASKSVDAHVKVLGSIGL